MRKLQTLLAAGSPTVVDAVGVVDVVDVADVADFDC